jgi:acetolactate synthase small subunit
MTEFQISYRNTQGTLMRILTAVSRRAIEVIHLEATPSGDRHRAHLLVAVNPKQHDQLCRDWRAIVDVVEVRAAARTREFHEPPPAGGDGRKAGAASA